MRERDVDRIQRQPEKRARISAEIVCVEACTQIIQDSTYHGISSEEGSSIQQLSREAITHARQIAECLTQQPHEEEFSVMPTEYSFLPVLAEDFEATQRKKVEISNHLVAQFGEIQGDEWRLLQLISYGKPCASFDYLKEWHQDAGKAQPAATRGNQEDFHQ